MQNQNKFLVFAFFIGMISLMYEIYIVKVIFLYFTENIYAVAITLSSFLAGLALSSYYVSRQKEIPKKQQIQILLGMQIGMLTYAILILQNHSWIPLITDFLSQQTQREDVIFVLKLVITWGFLLVPALFLGGALPLLTGLFQSNYESRTTDTSLIYFWDTLGASFGSLVVGIGFIPFLGIQNAFWIIVSFNLVIFIGIWFQLTLKKTTHCGLALFTLIIFGLGVSHFFFTSEAHEDASEFSLLNQKFFNGEDIVWQKNSAFGVVTVTTPDKTQPEALKFLYINYRQMCNSQDNKSSSEVDIAHNTTKLMPKAGRVLNIGLGCGMTAHALAQSEKIKHLNIAEINPMVVAANDINFRQQNEAILQNSKTKLFIKDGAEVIRQAEPESFAAVVIDIEEPTIIHSSPLFTTDYFSIIKDKLKPEGLFSLWFLENPKKDTLEAQKIILNSLKQEFLYVQAYRNPNYSGFSFYASQVPFQKTDIDSDSFNFVAQIESHPSTEINTINNRVLEQKFDVADYFSIPSEVQTADY